MPSNNEFWHRYEVQLWITRPEGPGEDDGDHSIFLKGREIRPGSGSGRLKHRSARRKRRPIPDKRGNSDTG